MDGKDFAIWFDGFVAGKDRLEAADIEILKKKIDGLRFECVPTYPWFPYPYDPYPPVYGPVKISDTSSGYVVEVTKSSNVD
jgi:hypothetical protein